VQGFFWENFGMDINHKIKELKAEVQNLDTERQMTKNRITELKSLVEDKKRKLAEIEKLKAEEAELLAELGI